MGKALHWKERKILFLDSDECLHDNKFKEHLEQIPTIKIKTTNVRVSAKTLKMQKKSIKRLNESKFTRNRWNLSQEFKTTFTKQVKKVKD